MSDINEECPKWGSKQSLVFFFGYYKYRYCTSFKGKRCLKLSLVKFLCLKLLHRSFFFFFVFPQCSHYSIMLWYKCWRRRSWLRWSCHRQPLIEAPSTRVHEKLLTVVSSRPSCWEMVICNSLDGRLFSLNIASKVRRWTSVKTSRGFLEMLPRSHLPCSCSFLLHAERTKGWHETVRHKMPNINRNRCICHDTVWVFGHLYFTVSLLHALTVALRVNYA